MITLPLSPIDSIRRKYQLAPQEQLFEFYLNWHLQNGFVFNTPEFFVMGRPIKTYRDEAHTRHGIDHLAIWAREEQNCWYVHAMAGDMTKAWSMLPYELPFMAFERVREGVRELTVVATARLQHLTHVISRPQMASA
jgi:hypothetical protein